MDTLDINVKKSLKPIDPNIIDMIRYIPDSCYISYSKQYPAAGLGVFAKKKIQKGTFLGNYVGRICDADHKGPYAFHVSVPNGKESNVWSIDAQNVHQSNFTRFINCALLKEHENVMIITCQNEGIFKGKLMFYAKRDISKDEELAYDYGIEYRNVLIQLNQGGNQSTVV